MRTAGRIAADPGRLLRPASLRGWRSLLLLLILLAVPTACSSASPPAPAGLPPLSDQALVEQLEERTFHYFWDLADPTTGLVPDRWPTPSFASVAAVGFALTACPIGAERGYVGRADAAARVLKTLRFLEQAPQSDHPTQAAGYKGFFYHFLDMKTGLRYAQVELSSIDTALLMAGALACQSYFSGADPQETEIRATVDRLYRRIDWTWFMPRPKAISLGWTPEHGFHEMDWIGYNEAMILLALALGAPDAKVPAEAWTEFTRTYLWAPFQGQDYLCFGPLFGHHFSHVWMDLRGVQDAYMAGKGIDYFENSRRAAYAQRTYAIQNPGQWKGYGAAMWGISACDGPADVTLTVDGRSRRFLTYAGRGVGAAWILDDGTVTPAAAAGSLPFAAEISLPVLQELRRRFGASIYAQYGFLDACNETFPAGQALYHGKMVAGVGWVDTDYIGIDQGEILTGIENYRSGLVWRLMRSNAYLVAGMKRAGFRGGWIDTAAAKKPGLGKRAP